MDQYYDVSADGSLAEVEDLNQIKTLISLISDFPLANYSSIPNMQVASELCFPQTVRSEWSHTYYGTLQFAGG